MAVALITGAAGLIGSEAAEYFAGLGYDVVGVDNDMRSVFFGADASTRWNRIGLEQRLGRSYEHHDVDIRDREAMERIFARYGSEIALVIHAAAQPSHDWAVRDPETDFSVNASGTLVVLEMTRRHAPEAVFVYTSTNKVYGDAPNRLPLVELETRWEIDPGHRYENGVAEDFPIDQSTHSLFGTSKLSADVMVQEYGRYFGMKTGVFRGGCLTGPKHAGAQLHGFLAYLMRCVVTGSPYVVYGYGGKQVRDNIHSSDFVRAIHAFYQNPHAAEVYNIGGGRHSNCSMLEAIALCEEITGRRLDWSYSDANRVGDHIWWISDVSKFQGRYPQWSLTYDVADILREIFQANGERWQESSRIA